MPSVLDTVQALVDGLAAELGQPVGLDDRRLRAVAYSPHADDVDPVRRDTILRRETPPAIAERLRARGIEQAHEHLRIPRDEDFAMKARVCVPVRYQETLLGFLWLLDEPEPVRGPQLRSALECARELGAQLYRARRMDSEDRAREAAYVRRLVGERSGPHAEPAAWRSRGIAAAPLYSCLAVEVVCDGAPCRAAAPALAAGVDAVQRALAPKRLVAALEEDRGVAVLAHEPAGGGGGPGRRAGARPSPRSSRRAPAAARWPASAARAPRPRSSRTPPTRRHRPRGSRPWSRSSGRWACGSTSAPTARSSAWPRRAVLRPRSRTRWSGSSATATPRRSCRRSRRTWTPAATPSRPRRGWPIHRSSLYNRLRRIEDVAGVDLRSGDARLELHLGLRLRRLAGRR